MKLSIIFILSIFLSCNQERYFQIKKNGTYHYKLGKVIKNKKMNNDDIEIYTNTQNIIISILIKSKKYKTSEGFGIGSNLNDLKKGSKKVVLQKSSLLKGNVPIGNLGNFFVYDGIYFIDSNENEIIDYIFITSE